MELERPNTWAGVNALASYCKGAWFVLNPDGRWWQVARHAARVRLMRRTGCTRPAAEVKLNEIIDWAASHPEEALAVKRRVSRTFIQEAANR